MKKTISILLNLCLGFFLASAVVSVIDDSFQLLFGLYFLTVISAVLSCISILTALAIYCGMAFFPMIPKRVIVPMVLFYAIGFFAFFPVAIYGGGDWSHRCLVLDWAASLCQVLVGLGVLRRVRGGWNFRWPLLDENVVTERHFGWMNLSAFLLANVLVILPAAIAYLIFCAALAIGHFTAGFVELRPRGLVVQVRHYARSDGKEIELVPMAHVADADFYRTISRSFPTNSIVLMEGVTDEKHLLTNGISYQRMARSLRLSEQTEVFKPQGTLIRADIDVDQFSKNTIDLLNLVMLVHVKGVNALTMMKLAHYSPPPHVEQWLFDDLVKKRNQHLLGALQTELLYSDEIIVPWGAGHMPDFANAIQGQGFHWTATEDYTVIRFH